MLEIDEIKDEKEVRTHIQKKKDEKEVKKKNEKEVHHTLCACVLCVHVA